MHFVYFVNIESKNIRLETEKIFFSLRYLPEQRYLKFKFKITTISTKTAEKLQKFE